MSFFSLHKRPRIDVDKMIADFYEPVYRYVRRVVGNHDDACDVCQETFMRAVNGIGGIDNPLSLRPWLFRIASNESMRFLRAKRTIDCDITDVLADTVADDYAQGELPDPRLAGFRLALETLTPAQRQIFSLRHYDDMSFREIADVVGGMPDTCRVVYHQAKEKLKKYLLSSVK